MKNWLLVISILILIAIITASALVLGVGRSKDNNESVSNPPGSKTEEVFTEQSSVNFMTDVLTNEKFGRHNLIWNSLDQPSKDIFGEVNNYEDFFDALSKIQQEKSLRNFQIDSENVVLRENWTSPQGVNYSPVYDMPVERTLNDSTTVSQTYYVFEVAGKLKITTGLTAKTYKDTKKELVEAGYFESAE